MIVHNEAHSRTPQLDLLEQMTSTYNGKTHP